MKLVKHVALFLLSLFLISCLAPEPRVVSPGHSPEKKSPPPWAPAHGKRAQHRYYYYPSQYLYFDLDRELWFFPQDGIWKFAPKLPPIILPPSPQEAIEILLDTDKPYAHFEEHKKKYPPGQMKKKKGKAKGKSKDKRWR